MRIHATIGRSSNGGLGAVLSNPAARFAGPICVFRSAGSGVRFSILCFGSLVLLPGVAQFRIHRNCGCGEHYGICDLSAGCFRTGCGPDGARDRDRNCLALVRDSYLPIESMVEASAEGLINGQPGMPHDAGEESRPQEPNSRMQP